jgi:predicted phosphodiesterase
MSDLHLEFDEGFFDSYGYPILFNPDLSNVDVLVLAGDVHVGTKAVETIRTWASIVRHVVYVLGNHEFYYHDMNNLLDNIKELLSDLPNVHVLEREAVVIDGVRFLGTTMWTDFDGGNPLKMMVAGNRMNDYALIKNEGRRLLPVDIYNIHTLCVDWLADELAKPFDGKTVVVTHHLPHETAIHPKWRNRRDEVSWAYFCTDCDSLIEKADLWIFGHQHENVHITIGQTTLLSNPRGYTPDGLNPDFDVLKTVKL